MLDNQNSEVVLSISGVSKKFCRSLKRSLMYGIQDITSEILGLRDENHQLRKQEFWALNNISFQLRRGEALGLVGKNGSGKSTLLRIIAGLIKPDAGSVEVTGRVAPLIALGAGFNPILTGRENIYANMAILGLSRKEIDERFDEVVDFAEIGEAIDAPVQTYSSGMAARLGFSSAIHTEPDILLIDEVLAVGDIKFREKCHRKLYTLRKNGTSLILVSHNNHELSNVCRSAVYLSDGNVLSSGSAFLVLEQYVKDMSVPGTNTSPSKLFELQEEKSKNRKLIITDICFKNSEEKIIPCPITGEKNDLCVHFTVKESIENINLYVVITAEEGSHLCLCLSSYHDNYKSPILSPGKQEIRLEFLCLVLNPGYYIVDVYLKEGSLYTHDVVESFRFQVEGKPDINHNAFYQARAWSVLENNS